MGSVMSCLELALHPYSSMYVFEVTELIATYATMIGSR